MLIVNDIKYIFFRFDTINNLWFEKCDLHLQTLFLIIKKKKKKHNHKL